MRSVEEFRNFDNEDYSEANAKLIAMMKRLPNAKRYETYVTAIQKFRDNNGRIYGYTIAYDNGKSARVTSDELKDLIKNEAYVVRNLTLTSDNRLVEKEDKPWQIDEYESKANQLAQLKKKVKHLGKCEEIHLNSDEFLLVHKAFNTHIVIIPDYINSISRFVAPKFHDTMLRLNGNIKIMGGRGLTDMQGAFEDCKFKIMDFSDFHTDRVMKMTRLFMGCTIEQHLNLSSFRTYRVTDMSEMFKGTKAPSLDISSFDTSNVSDMTEMFCFCTIPKIDLTSFNLLALRGAPNMFYQCESRVYCPNDERIITLASSKCRENSTRGIIW